MRVARSLVELAAERGLRLSCSPITFMGEAQQTMWRLVETGAIGAVRVAYAEVNWNRIESWHPRPEPFYRIGPFADVGVYPLTILTAIFGPARRVTAFGTVVYPNRITMDGEPFTPEAPDFGVAVVELESGTVVRLTANFYVAVTRSRAGSSSTEIRAPSISPTGSSSTPRSSSLASASRTPPCPSRGRSPAQTGAVPSVT